MKIIDLLNKIANEEELPKKIKFENDIYEYENNECGYVREENGIYYMFLNEIGNWYLNDEVEIIEENKIPENNFNYIYSCEDEHIMANFENIKTTLKDITDYLKSKGE